ncbi:hypothetical protein [Pseudonocardia nigra]|uniref:hypothetical protein n=1 Tax=Pseudonocardia nigra TaxID=1921578 RepID=UPI001C5F1A8C|nr:hypothetical protein [Pseudonocardia nigra]
MERLGYAPWSRAGHLRLMAHIGVWLDARGLDGFWLTPQVVGEFVAERRAAGCRDGRSARSLTPLLEYLREAGAAPPPGPAWWAARWRRCWPTTPAIWHGSAA